MPQTENNPKLLAALPAEETDRQTDRPIDPSSDIKSLFKDRLDCTARGNHSYITNKTQVIDHYSFLAPGDGVHCTPGTSQQTANKQYRSIHANQNLSR